MRWPRHRTSCTTHGISPASAPALISRIGRSQFHPCAPTPMFCSPRKRPNRLKRRWSTSARASRRESRRSGPWGSRSMEVIFGASSKLARPYMRARAGLAATLNALGEVDAAIGHYRDMLRLNPNDNQGIRYVLAGCLMKRGDTEALEELFKKYDEDGSALWLYSRALVAFRENEGSDAKANEFARNALRANRHVPAVLTGRKKAKPSTNGYLTMGGEVEAAHYVEEWGFDWLTTPGAIDWLTKIAAERAPTRTKRPSEH